MSEAIVATVEPHALAPVVPESKYALLKETLGPTLNNGQFMVFVHACNRLQLDPFLKQIHAVVRNEWNNNTRQKEPRMTIQTGIDGYRVVAERTRELDGEGDYQWCGPDGEWRDIWLDSEPPAAARATVYRKGRRPVTMMARWDAYAQRKADGSLNSMWSQRGPEQLVKCAVALAYRAGFPHDLSGVYTDEEMAQADNDRPRVQATATQERKRLAPSTPPPASNVHFFAESFPNKTYAGKPIEDAPFEILEDFRVWLQAIVNDPRKSKLHNKANRSIIEVTTEVDKRIEVESTKTVPIDDIIAGLEDVVHKQLEMSGDAEPSYLEGDQ